MYPLMDVPSFKGKFMAEEADDEELDSENQSVEEAEETNQVEEPVADTGAEDEKVKLKEVNKKLFERAKAAEAKVKELKEKPAENITTKSDILSREEAILIARDMDLEVLDEIKDYAKLKGLSLLKAKETPFAQHLIEQKETERKKEKAKLSASKGSPTHQEKSISDLSREEHMALAKEMAEKIQ